MKTTYYRHCPKCDRWYETTVEHKWCSCGTKMLDVSAKAAEGKIVPHEYVTKQRVEFAHVDEADRVYGMCLLCRSSAGWSAEDNGVKLCDRCRQPKVTRTFASATTSWADKVMQKLAQNMHVHRFVTERCELNTNKCSYQCEVSRAYKAWCKDHNERPMSIQRLNFILDSCGLPLVSKYIQGIIVKQTQLAVPPQTCSSCGNVGPKLCGACERWMEAATLRLKQHDNIKDFVAERCELSRSSRAPESEAYSSYMTWCAAKNLHPSSKLTFVESLTCCGMLREEEHIVGLIVNSTVVVAANALLAAESTAMLEEFIAERLKLGGQLLVSNFMLEHQLYEWLQHRHTTEQWQKLIQLLATKGATVERHGVRGITVTGSPERYKSQ